MPFFNAKKKKCKNFEVFGYIPNKLSYKTVKMKSGNGNFSDTFQNAFLITICQAKRKKLKIFCNIKENP